MRKMHLTIEGLDVEFLLEKTITLDLNESYKVTNLLEHRDGYISHASCKKLEGTKSKTLTIENILKAYVMTNSTRNTSSTGICRIDHVDAFLKDSIFRLVKDIFDYRKKIQALKEDEQNVRERNAQINKILDVHLKQRQGNEGVDTTDYSAVTQRKKQKRANSKFQEIRTTTKSLKQSRNSKLDSFVKLQAFLQTIGVQASRKTLTKWGQSFEVPSIRGKPPIISEDAEEDIFKIVMWNDEHGFPMNSQSVMRMVGEYVQGNEEVASNFVNGIPGKNWLKGWKKRRRERHPDLVQALRRDTSHGTTQWFHTTNINWWFDNLKRIALKFKIAEECDPSEGEFRWINKSRVIITDETGDGRIDKVEKVKVFTCRSRLESSTNKRRVNDVISENDQHIPWLVV